MTRKQGPKEPVRLRSKKLKGGGESLYLDIYYKGRRSYEFLRLYTIPENTQEDRDANRRTLALAGAIKAKRIVELQGMRHGFEPQEAGKVRFYDYYRALMQSYEGRLSENTLGSWRSALGALKKYDPSEALTFEDITQQWVEGFEDFLNGKGRRRGVRKQSGRLAEGTKWEYMHKLRACLNRALEDGIITRLPYRRGNKVFGNSESLRMYLTMDEVRRLAATRCGNDEVRRAFLFSCLTGLRFSDIVALKWGDVQQQDEFTRLVFRQRKTKGQEYLDISKSAADLLGERGRADERIFRLPSHPSVTKTLAVWVRNAGIEKHITFHCARHTFAVMMLDLGTDLYTVSKLLGHRDISTTQIYAKILDKNKQRAVERIPDLLNNQSGDDRK